LQHTRACGHRNDKAQVCSTLEPAATEPTPNEKPKTPTAALSVKQATMAGRNVASFHQGRLGTDSFTFARLRAQARYRHAVRILLVTWEFPPETVGGVGAHVEGLSQSLAKDGHDVCIFTLAAPGVVEDQIVAGVRIIRADAICHGCPIPTRLHSSHLAITTSPRYSPTSALGDQKLCTLTIGAQRGQLIRSQQCVRFRFSLRFIRPKADGRAEMFPKETPLQFILLNLGLPMFRSASFVVRDLCNAK